MASQKYRLLTTAVILAAMLLAIPAEAQDRNKAPMPILSIADDGSISISVGAKFTLLIGDASDEEDIESAAMRLNGKAMAIDGLEASGINTFALIEVNWNPQPLIDDGTIRFGQNNLIELELKDTSGQIVIAPAQLVIYRGATIGAPIPSGPPQGAGARTFEDVPASPITGAATAFPISITGQQVSGGVGVLGAIAFPLPGSSGYYECVYDDVGFSLFSVAGESKPLLCNICETGEWSVCTDGKQTRLGNVCGVETNYNCRPNVEERACGAVPGEVPTATPGFPLGLLLVPVGGVVLLSAVYVGIRKKARHL